MIDPGTGQPVVQPQPFNPQSVKAPTSGCGKPLLIGCGVLLVLLGAAAAFFVFKAKDLFTFLMEKTQEAIVAELSSEVTAEERQRLERAFAAAAEVILSGASDPEALQQVQRRISAALQQAGSGGISREETLELIRALERLAGIESPVQEPETQGDSDEPVLEAALPRSLQRRCSAAGAPG